MYYWSQNYHLYQLEDVHRVTKQLNPSGLPVGGVEYVRNGQLSILFLYIYNSGTYFYYHVATVSDRRLTCASNCGLG